MSCKGCAKKRKKFRKEVKQMKDDQNSRDKATEHFMKVCKHGVPHGYMCKGCDKIISIPEDAVIKPEKVKEE